jgi:hypothetical protein
MGITSQARLEGRLGGIQLSGSDSDSTSSCDSSNSSEHEHEAGEYSTLAPSPIKHVHSKHYQQQQQQQRKPAFTCDLHYSRTAVRPASASQTVTGRSVSSSCSNAAFRRIRPTSAPYGNRSDTSVVELHSVQVMQHSQSCSGASTTATATATAGAATADKTLDRKRLQVCLICIDRTISDMLFLYFLL